MKTSYLNYVLCLVLSLIHFSQATAEADNKEEDGTKKAGSKETELLDKEYGVRYANECEGKH